MGEFNSYRNANNLFLQALTVRRNVFVSYYHGDQSWAQTFVDTFGKGLGKVFNPKALGLSYDDDEIQSDKTDYVMDQIREHYISDSSVQIVLIGSCTHSRRYIDWEIKRCLTKGNGLIGILIPPHTSAHLPDRFSENWSSGGDCYARYHAYPSSAGKLREWIEDGYEARTTRATLIHNARESFANNHVCKVCGSTH